LVGDSVQIVEQNPSQSSEDPISQNSSQQSLLPLVFPDTRE